MFERIRKQRLSRQAGRLSLSLLLLLALVPAAGAPASGAPHAQPALLAYAVQHPTGSVSVIVQKLGSASHVEDLVSRLGGQVTRDLSIIHAFAAEVPAAAVSTLAEDQGVRWVSLNAPLAKSGTSHVNTHNLQNAYIRTIGADRVWNDAPHWNQGEGIGVAVVDTGMFDAQDFQDLSTGRSRIIAATSFLTGTPSVGDQYGHGTHVAGIIAGNGSRSSGTYIGVAPKANLLNLKISDRDGTANAADVVAAFQWILANKDRYNIRVVNLSVNSSVAESYLTSPIDAAVEILWFNKIVVVVSAGNNGLNAPGVLYPPANDPFVITVGATDDRGTADPSDDVVAPYSSYGATQDGVAKPDLVAPGTNIVSVLANPGVQLAQQHRDHIVRYRGDGAYFRMSGTSMAAPMVSGAVALVLQSNPNLTPDDVKLRLMSTTQALQGVAGAGAGLLDADAAVHSTVTGSNNAGIRVSSLLGTGSQSIQWNSVNWNTVNWNTVNWNTVNWNTVNWNCDFWDR